MAPKSRRQSSGHHSNGQATKKQKTASASTPQDLTSFFNQTIEKVLELSDGDYRISIDFSTLPDEEQYPEYYDEIETPISIAEIKQAVKQHTYQTPSEFKQAFKLMADNAIKFNEEESDIAQNALRILKTVEEEVEAYSKSAGEIPAAPVETPSKTVPKIKIRVGGKSSIPEAPSKESDLKQKLTQIVKQIKEFKDNGVLIAEPFLEEVDRDEYPDYYVVIKHAMAFSTVERKIEAEEYQSIEEFVTDVELIWKNAQTYNEEGSLIYDDSKTLEAFFKSLVSDLIKEDTPQGSASENSTNTTALESDAADAADNAEPVVETPVKRKIGRPKGKTKLNLVVAQEQQALPLPVIDLKPDLLTELEQEYLPATEQHQELISEVVEPEIPDPIESIPKLLENTAPKISKNVAASEILIQELTISSSRSLYRQTVKANLSIQSPNLFQNWFEYQFRACDNQPTTYSLTLPPQQGAVSVSAGLNDSLIKKKHSAYLTVNGERVNPTPSIHYADSGRTLTSRYELKLAPGLNMVVFDVIVGESNEDDLGKIKSSNDARSEKLTIWVQVI